MKPGLAPSRLAALARAAVQRCALDLSGRVVLTEAATGAYSVTPVLAALGGADRVYAVTRDTRYGTVAEVSALTAELAGICGVADRIEVVTVRSRELVASADVVTNCGHLRPIDAETVSWMRPGTAVPLMYEAWELRDSDVDVAACRRAGVRVAGTNERHPAVDVFSYLGIMAVSLLLDAGVAVYGSRVLLLCDNPFLDYLRRGLSGAGADVHTCACVSELDKVLRLSDRDARPFDAVLVALRPGPVPVFDAGAVAAVAELAPGAVVAQFWGDLDHAACWSAGLPVWPAEPPEPGHMGVLPSAVGPEPVVRLQAGGLKVGELLSRRTPLSEADTLFLQPV